MHDRLAVFVTNDWLCEFFVPRHRSKLVQDGSMHIVRPFDRYLKAAVIELHGDFEAAIVFVDGKRFKRVSVPVTVLARNVEL